MTKIEYFQLPIYYIEKKYNTSLNILDDLELIETKDCSGTSLYNYVFQPQTCFGEETIPLWAKYYTDNKAFLKDNQKILKEFNPLKNTVDFKEVQNIWNELQTETGFKEKYHYVEWDFFKNLNHNASFLQILSLYNLTSPLVSLLLPFIFLILPFFIIRIQGIELSISKYSELLKQLLSKHALGQLFTEFKHVEWDKRIYLIISVFFYLFQIYQNMLACYRFYINITKIHKYLFTIRDYIDHTLQSMDNYLKYSHNLSTHKSFIIALKHHYANLKHFKQQLDKISSYTFSLRKVNEIGHVMKCFYDLYCQKDYNESMMYSFGYHGYIDNLIGLQNHMQNNNINLCKFTKKKSSFKGAYYPALLEHNPIKNTYNLSKQLLITGPNAAGKTTILKTTLFNTLLSQQIGCGFYKTAHIFPYKHIHCYLNIPDTSGRDSLFQAEARRCKEILDSIISSKSDETHFCIFDELYSGTNPYEAVGSAFSFLSFLTKYSNVSFILTTHYLDLCKRLEQNPFIENYHMKIQEKDANFTYTYKLHKGISKIKGGVKVLNDLDYPKEIINNTIQTIERWEI